jgi:cytidylate kinase
MKDPPAWRIIESMASSPIVQQEKYARGAVKLFQVPEVAHWCLEYMKLLPFSFGDCPQIFEGRGIGRLFPTAPVKIWLDGDKETRFRRKHTDAEKFGPAVYSDTVKSNTMRDELEAQNALVPSKPGHGDIRIDTTRMTREQVLAYVIAVCNYKTLSRH